MGFIQSQKKVDRFLEAQVSVVSFLSWHPEPAPDCRGDASSTRLIFALVDERD